MNYLRPGSSAALPMWNGLALSSIAVGDISEVMLFTPGQGPAFGVFTMSFDSAPTAVQVDLEFSEGGNIWRKLKSFTKVAGESFVTFLNPGFYRGRLVSKTGTTQLLTITVLATEEFPTEVLVPSANDIVTPNGAERRVRYKELEITLATGALTTDSANFLPANSRIIGLSARVTEAINNVTNWAVGDPTTLARFIAAQTTKTLGFTAVGTDFLQPAATNAAGPVQVAAAALRITCTGTQNTTGKVRISMFYEEFVPAIS